jgi:hypothetical protein
LRVVNGYRLVMDPKVIGSLVLGAALALAGVYVTLYGLALIPPDPPQPAAVTPPVERTAEENPPKRGSRKPAIAAGALEHDTLKNGGRATSGGSAVPGEQ